jgi:threonine/homoserine/homoserine lactone efflux protein
VPIAARRPEATALVTLPRSATARGRRSGFGAAAGCFLARGFGLLAVAAGLRVVVAGVAVIVA